MFCVTHIPLDTIRYIFKCILSVNRNVLETHRERNTNQYHTSVLKCNLIQYEINFGNENTNVEQFQSLNAYPTLYL